MSQEQDDLIDDSPSSGDHKKFQFTIVDGEVTEVFEFKNGELKQKPIDGESEYYIVDVDSGEIERTEENAFGREITRYADTDGDKFYTRISERWESNDPSEQGAHFKFEDELKYSPSDDNDDIAVRGGEDSHGGKGEDSFVIREASHLRIADFHQDENDDIVFDTGFGLTSKDEIAQYVKEIRQEGDDLVVDFGPSISITLVGVHAGQISWDDVSVLS